MPVATVDPGHGYFIYVHQVSLSVEFNYFAT